MTRAAPRPGTPRCLLIVEDDAQFRAFLEELFAGEGYATMLAANGEEALDRYEETRPDLVVTDLVMPDSDGVELIMQLRHVDRSVPIVAISGGNVAAAESYLKVAEAIGADAIFEKPFDTAAIRRTVRALLGE